MKKRLLLTIAVCIMLCGIRVQAQGTDNVDANDLIQKTSTAMETVKVIGLEMWMDNQMLMDISMDQNTNVTYMSMILGGQEFKVWLDNNTGMGYSYDPTVNRYYFQPMDKEDLEENTGTDTDEATEVDTSLTYTYIGKKNVSVKGQDTECYQVSASMTEDGHTSTCIYSISVTDYRLIAMDMTITSGMMSMNAGYYYYYPASVTIPEEVRSAAKLAEGYSFTKGKIGYTVKYVKNEPVLYVENGTKAKSTAVIPDSIKICGKAYPVYGIGTSAFLNNKKITSITLGKNIEVIEKYAFYQCKKLKSMKINSENLKSIGKKAFYGNDKTLTIKVPKKKIGKYQKLITKSKSKGTVSSK